MKIPWTGSLLCFAATAAAQATQLTELPQCAVGCFQQAVVETTSCNPTDTACLCGGDNTVKIEKRASGCVQANCETPDEISPLFEEVCSGALASEQEAGGDEVADEGVVDGDVASGEAPPEEIPVEEAPVEEAPVEDVPVEEAPVEDAASEEIPAEAPVEAAESPVDEAVAAEAPVEEVLPRA